MKHNYLVPLVLIGLMGVATGSRADDRIGMSVGNFRPMEAETSKFLTPIQRTPIAGQKTDLSAEDRAYISPEELGEIRRMEVYQKIQERIKEIQAAEEQDKQRELEIDRLRQSMLGQPEMRPLFAGGKKLAARLSQYGVFRILERNDMAELLQEAGGESKDKSAAAFAAGRVAASYKVYVDVGDLRQNTSQGNVGGVNFKDTIFSRDFILKLQSVADGSIALSQTFKITKKQTVTDVGGMVSETVHEEMVDDAVEQMAAAIYQNFMATIKFSFRVMPNNPNLDPSMVAVYVLNADGAPIDSASDGAEITLRKGRYTLQCDSSTCLFNDGKDKVIKDFSSSRTENLMFQSSMQDVEFAFNDPDGNFPSITLTPTGWVGEVVYVSSPGQMQIRKGNYKLKATLDGYRDMDKPQQITQMTKTIPIQMMKLPSAATAVQSAQ